MNENNRENELDPILAHGLAQEANAPQQRLDSLEDRAKFARARFKWLERHIHGASIGYAEAIDDGHRSDAQAKIIELQELGERYRLSDEAFRPAITEIAEIEEQLEAIARKWGVPADESDWSSN